MVSSIPDAHAGHTHCIKSIKNDEEFALDLLSEQKVFVVSGKGFNYNDGQHFRAVFLPEVDTLELAINKVGEFLDSRRVKSKKLIEA